MICNIAERTKSLQKIAMEINNCSFCKKYKIGQLFVPGEGNPCAKVIFMGEAGGATEAKLGLPFRGRAGKFLNKMLDKTDIKREDIYITSPVKYFPGRRAPSLDEIRHGMIHTKKQIEVIKPKIIVLLGNVAIKALLDEKLRVSDIHGKIIEKDGVKYFPTFHPSAAMRFTGMRIKMEKDFKKLKSLLI
jgi:DNA polymerase